MIRVLAEDDGPDSAPRIVITCTWCDTAGTVNDEAGQVPLLDLLRWGLDHNCAATAAGEAGTA